MARRRDVHQGRRSIEVSVSGCRQAWPAHRLHAAAASKYTCSIPSPQQSADNDAGLACFLHHHGQASFISRSDQTAETGRQALGKRQAPNIEVFEQHHRGQSWRSQAGNPPHPRVPDHEDCHGNHLRVRDHAHDPTWSLPHLQARSKERSTLRQLTVRHRSITPKSNAEPNRACQELMQQSPSGCH